MKPRLFHSCPKELSVIDPQPNWTADRQIHDNLVFAQPDEVMAHAYALKVKNCVFRTGYDVGKDWCFMVLTPELGVNWRDNLIKTPQGLGGYIYEVDPSTFEERKGEWLSRKPAIILNKRFVSIEDAMKAGVQIFIIMDTKKYSLNSAEVHQNPAGEFLVEAYKSGGIQWLNQDQGINPLMPPSLRGSSGPSGTAPTLDKK